MTNEELIQEALRVAKIRAQIEVLEELLDHFDSPGGRWFGQRYTEKEWVKAKIAALRKEIGE